MVCWLIALSPVQDSTEMQLFGRVKWVVRFRIHVQAIVVCGSNLNTLAWLSLLWIRWSNNLDLTSWHYGACLCGCLTPSCILQRPLSSGCWHCRYPSLGCQDLSRSRSSWPDPISTCVCGCWEQRLGPPASFTGDKTRYTSILKRPTIRTAI